MATGGGKGGDRHVPVPALLWYSGILELGIGAFMLVSPELFAADSYAPIRPLLGLVAAVFVLGGGAAILAVSGLCPPRLLPFAPLVAAVPPAVLAGNFLLTSVATGVITYSLQVVALLACAWLTVQRGQPRVRAYVHMVGAVLIALGLAMLVDQEHFSNQLTYSDLGRFLWLVIPLFLVAGLGLIVAELRAATRPVAGARLVLTFASLGAIGLGIARTRGGEARAQADIEGDDEIGVLAHSFNQLTRELADQSDLNEAVRRAQSDLGEAIVILENGVPRQWNEALTRITGYSDADLHAMRSLYDLLPNEQRAEVEEIARARVRDTFTFETEILKRNGERAYLEIAVIPLRNMRPPQQLAIVRDISERKSAERSLERLALHDALTDLPNRALLTDRLERTIAAAGRANDSFALLYLDLDRFKQVNDAFGHDAGDELAARLGRPLTSADTLARFGGDEFAILLPRAGTPDEALDMASVVRPARVCTRSRCPAWCRRVRAGTFPTSVWSARSQRWRPRWHRAFSCLPACSGWRREGGLT